MSGSLGEGCAAKGVREVAYFVEPDDVRVSHQLHNPHFVLEVLLRVSEDGPQEV